jgi:hypothetical protein
MQQQARADRECRPLVVLSGQKVEEEVELIGCRGKDRTIANMISCGIRPSSLEESAWRAAIDEKTADVRAQAKTYQAKADACIASHRWY